MKICTRCSEEKSLDEFQKRKASKDGLTASCKNCLRKYDKSRANLPHRIKARNEYQKTDAGKRSKKKTVQRYRRENPNKYKAHNIVNNAVRDEKLFPLPCEECFSTHDLHAHHDDYAKPLNIRWLCSKHHREWHKENGEALNP